MRGKRRKPAARRLTWPLRSHLRQHPAISSRAHPRTKSLPFTMPPTRDNSAHGHPTSPTRRRLADIVAWHLTPHGDGGAPSHVMENPNLQAAITNLRTPWRAVDAFQALSHRFTGGPQPELPKDAAPMARDVRSSCSSSTRRTHETLDASAGTRRRFARETLKIARAIANARLDSLFPAAELRSQPPIPPLQCSKL